jgi:hypothetical protein
LPVLPLGAMARREGGASSAGPTWPGGGAWPGGGLPASPAPWRGLAPPGVLGAIRRPSRRRQAVPVTGRLCLPGPPGAEGAAHVRRRLSAGLPRPADAGGPAPPRPGGGAGVACGGRAHPRPPPPAPCRSGPRPAGDAAPPAAARRRGRRLGHLGRPDPPHDAAMDARRATGGWLTLPRPGLAPCQRRQACLGAGTPGVSCGWKRARRRSGRCKPSAPRPCSSKPLTRQKNALTLPQSVYDGSLRTHTTRLTKGDLS